MNKKISSEYKEGRNEAQEMTDATLGAVTFGLIWKMKQTETNFEISSTSGRAQG